MRFHFPRKYLLFWLICFGLLSSNGVAFAQVYKSYDADGNVVFSDKPTQRSQEIDISKPNLSDSFDVPSPPAVESPAEAKPEVDSEPEPATQPISEYDPADTNKDGRVSRREKEKERKKKRKERREQEKAAEGYEE